MYFLADIRLAEFGGKSGRKIFLAEEFLVVDTAICHG